MSPWIVIPSWSKYNHRADRSLPWFKVYYELSRHDDWRSLSLSARGLLVSIWLEYGPSRGQIRTGDIHHRAGVRVRKETLESLVAAGFVRLSDTRPSEIHAALDKKREDKKPLTPQSGATPRERKENPRALGTNPRAEAKKTAPKRKAENWIANGLADQVPPERLSAVIAEEFGITDPELLEELVTKARAH